MGAAAAVDGSDGLVLSSQIKDVISTGLSLVMPLQCVRMLGVFRRSIRRVIGGGYQHRETLKLEGGLDGGTIMMILAKLKVTNDWARHRQHSQGMITRPACIRTSNFSLRCSNSTAASSVVRFRNCASGNL
jgi:hypothetical protein